MKSLSALVHEALKDFGQQRFRTSVKVKVEIPGAKPFVDAVKGLNIGHAIHRAKWNWPGAKITSLGILQPNEELPEEGKNPFKQDLRLGPGGERDGGQSRERGSDGDATYTGSGNGYSSKGQKGWSRSAKAFDEPIDSIPLDKSNFDNHIGETEEIWSDLPVGSRTAEFGNGGRGGAGIKTLFYGPRKK